MIRVWRLLRGATGRRTSVLHRPFNGVVLYTGVRSHARGVCCASCGECRILSIYAHSTFTTHFIFDLSGSALVNWTGRRGSLAPISLPFVGIFRCSDTVESLVVVVGEWSRVDVLKSTTKVETFNSCRCRISQKAEYSRTCRIRRPESVVVLVDRVETWFQDVCY